MFVLHSPEGSAGLAKVPQFGKAWVLEYHT